MTAPGKPQALRASTVRLKRIKGAPLAELGVVPFPENGFTVITAHVQDPVTIPAVTLRDVFEANLLVVRQVLGNLGVKGIGEEEINVISGPQPQIGRGRKPKVQRYTTLCEATERGADPRVCPVRHLVLVTVDFQREDFLRHNRRVLHAARVIRRNRKAFRSNAAKKKPAPAATGTGVNERN